MKKLIAVCSAVSIFMSNMAYAAGGTIWFTDFNLHDNNVFVNDNYNILRGYSDGSFRPDEYITRAEFAGILVRERMVEHFPKAVTLDTEINFTDISNTHPLYEDVKKAVNLGIINGYSDGTFKPDDYITFEQAITMTLSMLGYRPLAEMYGGYPTGYMALGYNMRFFKAAGSSLDWQNCNFENMTSEKQKMFITRGDAAQFASRAFSSGFCTVVGIKNNWDGSHSYETSVVNEIYTGY